MRKIRWLKKPGNRSNFVGKGFIMTAQRITKEPQFNLLQKITLFLLILAGMNFLNQYKILTAVACVLYLFCSVKFIINKDMMWLLLLAVSWVAFSPEGTKTLPSMIMPFTFLLAYCVGLNFLPKDNQEKAEKSLSKAIIAVSIGPFVHFVLNFINNFGKNVERNSIDFWTGLVMSATGQATLSLMMLSVAIVMLFTNTQARNKVWSVLVLVAIFFYNLTLAGRTLFVMLMLLFAVSLLFLLIKGEKKGDKYKTLLIVVLIILMLTVLYNLNVFGIQDMIKSSNLYDRFFGRWAKDLDEDSRMEKKLNFLQNFGKSIWGGVHLRPLYGYAHDILLDTYDEAGILALIAVLMFLISAVRRLISCLKNRTLKFETQQWILGMYIAILVQFTAEPVIQGIPWMFMLFCFIHGMVTQLDKTSRRRATELNQNKN